MTPSASRTRKTPKKKPQSTWIRLLPLIAGIVVTPFAVWGASVLAMSGPQALRLLYPYISLLQGHSDQFPHSRQETIQQLVMFGQFPFYGAMWILMQRLLGGTAGPLSVLILHCVGVGAAILTAGGS
jgi:hypothetical protein